MRTARGRRTGGAAGADDRRSRSVILLLLLAAFTVITLDARAAPTSPIEPLRTVAGALFGPLQTGAAALVRPVRALPQYVADMAALRAANQRLAEENARLRSWVETSQIDRERAADLDRLLDVSEQHGWRLLPARVVSIGPAQAFSHTVTIDAGRADGVVPDLTVINADGLVGRVVEASRSTATVLLIVDPSSVVGGRLAATMELGFVRGLGDVGDDARLELELVDDVAILDAGDTVVTWGSRHQAPYVAGVRIGHVTQVRSDPRELTATALVEPVVDFSALDTVAVVVAAPPRPPRETLAATAVGGRR